MNKGKATQCYGSRPYFRLTLPDGSRENITFITPAFVAEVRAIARNLES